MKRGRKAKTTNDVIRQSSSQHSVVEYAASDDASNDDNDSDNGSDKDNDL